MESLCLKLVAATIAGASCAASTARTTARLQLRHPQPRLQEIDSAVSSFAAADVSSAAAPTPFAPSAEVDVSSAAASITSGFGAEHESSSPTDEQYDWLSQWYPVNVVETLDPSRPHALALLGLSLVIWNDGPTVRGKKQAGAWHVFEDACPHRLGPLSEGRVEADGNLLCSYHGWRFDGDGSCANLPYSPPKAAARQRCSCRAQCGSYPTRVVDGLLWVFPRSGPAAHAESQRVVMPLIEELHRPELRDRWEWKVPAGVRDFPCGWDTMLENTLDPAHFCAAHHGTLGNRYTDPQPYRFEITRKIDRDAGFAVAGDFGTLEFQPPCLVKYVPDYSGMPFGGSLVLATYCVPTRPGWVRPLATVLHDREHELGSTLAERALGVFMAGVLPTWLGHVLSSVVLHQDAGLLYKQYRNLRERGYNAGYSALASPNASNRSSPRYEQLVYTPTSVDRGVLLFRHQRRRRRAVGVRRRPAATRLGGHLRHVGRAYAALHALPGGLSKPRGSQVREPCPAGRQPRRATRRNTRAQHPCPRVSGARCRPAQVQRLVSTL